MGKEAPELTPLEIISRVRGAVPELSTYIPDRWTDAYLYKFVRARKFNVDAVIDMVKAHVKWCHETGIETMVDFDFPELPRFRQCYPHGYHGTDKLGRPLYIERLSKVSINEVTKVTTIDRAFKYFIRGYEESLKYRFPACEVEQRARRASLRSMSVVDSGVGAQDLSPPATGLAVNKEAIAPAHYSEAARKETERQHKLLVGVKSLCVLDIQGVGFSNFSFKVKNFVGKLNKMASENYPECLGTLFFVNAPSMFSKLYGLVSPILDPVTRSKIQIIPVKQTKAKLLEYVDIDQLPFFLGGNCKCSERIPGSSPRLYSMGREMRDAKSTADDKPSADGKVESHMNGDDTQGSGRHGEPADEIEPDESPTGEANMNETGHADASESRAESRHSSIAPGVDPTFGCLSSDVGPWRDSITGNWKVLNIDRSMKQPRISEGRVSEGSQPASDRLGLGGHSPLSMQDKSDTVSEGFHSCIDFGTGSGSVGRSMSGVSYARPGASDSPVAGCEGSAGCNILMMGSRFQPGSNTAQPSGGKGFRSSTSTAAQLAVFQEEGSVCEQPRQVPGNKSQPKGLFSACFPCLAPSR